MFQIGSSKFTEDGSQIQLKTAMSTINSTRVFMFLCTLEFNLFNFCKSEFRFSLYLSIIYTSVFMQVWSFRRSYYSTVDLFLLYNKFIIANLLVCVFIITEFRA